MARICKACRQPVDDPRDHDCPEDDDPQAEPDPSFAAAEECTVTLHVSGSVTTERDLLEALQRRMPGPGGLSARL